MEHLLIRDNLNEFLQYYHNKEIDFNKTFRMACAYGAINIIKYIATSTPHIINMNWRESETDPFERACRCSHLNIMVYLIKLSIKHPIYKLKPVEIYFNPILGTGSIALEYAQRNETGLCFYYIVSLGNYPTTLGACPLYYNFIL